MLDDRGAAAGCSALDARHCLVVGRADAISVYTRDTRGPVFVFQGGPPPRPPSPSSWRLPAGILPH